MKYQLISIQFLTFAVLPLLLLAPPSTASRYLPDVPEEVRRLILEWGVNVGRREYIVGFENLTKPYNEEAFNTLIAGLKHPHPAARRVASQLLSSRSSFLDLEPLCV